MKRLIIFMFASLFLASVQAEIYRWVDSEGNIQLTETPPPPEAQAEGTTVEKMDMPTDEEADETTEETAEEASDAAADNPEEGVDETTADGEDQTAAEKIQAAKRRNCKVAQDRMKTLTSKAALLKKDEEGNEVLMSDEMRQSAIAETQEYVKMYCGSGDEAE